MVANPTFQVYIISSSRYRRGPITAKNFLEYFHVVRESQRQLYIDNGFENVMSFEDSLINSYTKVFNFLVDNAKEDIIAIVDDDIDFFRYRTDTIRKIESPEIVQAEFERLGQIIYDLDLGLAFGPPNSIPYNYTSEFSWFGIPGAWKIVNRHFIKAKMDATIERNVDIDYVLQEVLHNRICIDAKYLTGEGYKDSITTTSGSLYSKNDVENSIEKMELRWGKHFRYDRSRNIPKIIVDR